MWPRESLDLMSPVLSHCLLPVRCDCWPICSMSAVCICICLHADDCLSLCLPYQRPLLYHLTQKKHGMGRGDKVCSTEILKRTLQEAILQTSADPRALRKANGAANRWYQVIPIGCLQLLWWVLVVWDWFQAVSCFRQMAIRMHIHTCTLGWGMEQTIT